MSKIIDNDLKYILNETKSLLNEVNGKTIFITGGTGFFGKWLLDFFLYLNNNTKIKCQLIVLSRNPNEFLKEYNKFNVPFIQFLKGDILTFDYNQLTNIDYIIHAATDADAKLNSENPLLMLETITIGTKRILDFAKNQENLKSFLLTSSGAIYGKQPQNIAKTKETDSFPIDINTSTSAYAEGKRIAELYSAIYSSQHNVPIKIARCFAFVGPYLPLDKHFAVGNFISDVLSKRETLIKGDGTALRSYMYASDLVIWLLTILIKGENNVPYNVGSDVAISIFDLATLVNKNQIEPKEIKVLGLKDNNRPIEQYIPSITRGIETLNLKLTVSLEEAIQRTLQFHQE